MAMTSRFGRDALAGMTFPGASRGHRCEAHAPVVSVEGYARGRTSRDRACGADGLDRSAGEHAGAGPGMGLVALKPASPTPRQRDRALDLLRGYLLCVILVDHIHWFPSLFEPLTGCGQLWASAAEGFLLISGFLV